MIVVQTSCWWFLLLHVCSSPSFRCTSSSSTQGYDGRKVIWKDFKLPIFLFFLFSDVKVMEVCNAGTCLLMSLSIPYVCHSPLLCIWPQVAISRHRIIARFGLMHMIGTNLCIWLNVLVQETKHEIINLRFGHGSHDGSTGTVLPSEQVNILFKGSCVLLLVSSITVLTRATFFFWMTMKIYCWHRTYCLASNWLMCFSIPLKGSLWAFNVPHWCLVSTITISHIKKA